MAQPLPEPISLPSPPNDGITSLSYLPSSSLLASTSWDGALRLHDADARSHVATQVMESGPLLSMSVGPAAGGGAGGAVYTGGIDGSVKKFDVATSSVTLIGRHSPGADQNDLLSGKKKVAASCLSTIDANLVASGGWDKKFHVWDLRGGDKNGAVATLDLPGKAFGMDASSDGTKVVVATSGRRNCFFDIRKLESGDKENEVAKLLLERESSLKYQTRCVKFFPDTKGIAVGSVEGRVAIEYLEDIGIVSGKKKYAFKCHRINDAIYPVNDVAFHPIHGTFATGGADGTVVTWDGRNKKKLSGIAKCPTSVARLAFNNDGTQIAMASSYTYEEGERDHPREEIYVRDVLDNEVRPKAKK
eukprot:CAMPEP_0172578342 /NCGR_PEP_ID=MMETSP1067-20121228/138684_1 /TAXON_ID=265564 ORGANISM="Thalassiosira punctigera, Strain Tpunct2005C2" /NCGR_SAMPLE_ID=MMETSP1067 /ASSEMBLY_ACC=CAM_ASM_000444 /LENGTH=359 /DNA_ID=CAMNT_0013371035 /DNA_START=62 /DNA_END=1141 /DNA_ORIENTATION=+